MKKVLIFAIIFLCGCQSPPKNPSAPEIGLEIGKTAPDFNYTSLSGQEGSLSDLRGKPVLLNIWATWCGPCVVEMPYFENIYQQHGEDISIIAVNATEPRQTVQDFINENGYAFPVALDEDMAIGQLYNVQTIPQTYVLDENGVIVNLFPYSISQETLDEVVSEILPD